MRKNPFFSFFSPQKQYSLQGRLLLYFSLLILIVFFCLLLFLFLSDALNSTQKDISKSLEDYLASYEESVSQQFNNLAAYGITLSKAMSREVEGVLQKNGLDFQQLQNNKEAIHELQDTLSKTLVPSMLISKASGIFVVFDTTINSALENAHHFRSGIYYKIMNISSPNDANPMIFMFRGQPNIAAKNAFELHNNWDLEFDVAPYERFFKYLRKNKKNISRESYYFTIPYKFENDWEEVILLATPIIGTDGEFYGVCGFEISEVLYSLVHGHIRSSMSSITGLVATENMDVQKKPVLNLYTNFSHGCPPMLFSEIERFSIEKGEFYDTFSNEKEVFVGKRLALRVYPKDFFRESPLWSAVALIPKETEEKLIWSNYLHIILFVLLCISVSFALSYYLARRYSRPIINVLSEIQSGNNTSTDIAEFSTFIDFVKNKENNLRSKLESSDTLLTADKRELISVDISAYKTFLEQIETLTKSERIVFELYTKGYSSQKVAKKLNVSINTIRTHNRNIYGKLYVTSYKELMVYIKMMRGNDTA